MCSSFAVEVLAGLPPGEGPAMDIMFLFLRDPAAAFYARHGGGIELETGPALGGVEAGKGPDGFVAGATVAFVRGEAEGVANRARGGERLRDGGFSAVCSEVGVRII